MTENNPAGTPPANDPKGGQPPVNPPKDPEKKSLTQAEIDAIVEDRLKRDRQSREEKLAADLGMPLKDVKAMIAAQKKAEEDAKTELQKANEKAAAAENALKDRDLRDLKRTKVDALIAEKKIALPEGATVADILDMVSGTGEADLDLTKVLKLFPVGKGLGTGTQGGQPPKPPTLQEELAAEQAKGDKADAMKLIQLRGLIAGETKK